MGFNPVAFDHGDEWVTNHRVGDAYFPLVLDDVSVDATGDPDSGT